MSSHLRTSSFIGRVAPAVAIAVAGAALAFAYAYRREGVIGTPALHLRPYLGGADSFAEVPSIWLRGGIFGAIFGLAYFALDRAIERRGFNRHPPAVALAICVFMSAPAWSGVYRFDFGDLFDPSFGNAVDRAIGGEAGRALAGIRAFAEAPLRAFTSDQRLELPTGGESPNAAFLYGGIAVHALFFAAATMLAGRRTATVGLIGALATGVLTPMILPAYLPGTPWHALPILAWYVAPLAFSLTTAGASSVRSIAAGLAVGAVIVSLSAAQDRAPRLARRGAALLGPEAAAARERGFVDETDPARLVLYLVDVAAYDRTRGDAAAIAPAAFEAAARRARTLIDAGAAALAPEKLDAILTELSVGFLKATPSVAPGAADPEYRALIASLAGHVDVVGRLFAGKLHTTFRQIVPALLETTAVPDAAEILARSPDDPEGRALLVRLRTFLFAAIEPAMRTGDVAAAAALREAFVELAPAEERTENFEITHRAEIAYCRVLAGDYERGAADLRALQDEAWLPVNNRAVYAGALGVAQLAEGDAASAAKNLKTFWDLYGSKWNELSGGVRSDMTEYWIVAELAAARRDAFLIADPPLGAQAARDVVRMLEDPLKAPAPPLPALVLAAEARLKGGRREEALELFRRAKDVPFTEFVDRSDGPVGRFAWPRFRRRALEGLRSLLDGAENAEERAAVDAELSGLRR